MSKPFRRRNALAVHELHYGPNMTPMVDVVMVILIFFMASAAVLGPEWFLRSSIPAIKANAAGADQQPKRVQIRMHSTADGTRLDVDQQSNLTFDSLAPLLRSMLKERTAESLVVLISPEPSVPYDDVVQVHAVCERLQLRKVGLFDPTAGPTPAANPSTTPSERTK